MTISEFIRVVPSAEPVYFIEMVGEEETPLDVGKFVASKVELYGVIKDDERRWNDILLAKVSCVFAHRDGVAVCFKIER